jgi:hypothetical protein
MTPRPDSEPQRLTTTQEAALDALSWWGVVRQGRGYSLRTMQALERRGLCYVTWVEGTWKAVHRG